MLFFIKHKFEERKKTISKIEIFIIIDHLFAELNFLKIIIFFYTISKTVIYFFY